MRGQYTSERHVDDVNNGQFRNNVRSVIQMGGGGVEGRWNTGAYCYPYKYRDINASRREEIARIFLTRTASPSIG